MAEPEYTLEELYEKSRAAGSYDEAILGWRYRLARGHARRAVAESQLRRLTTLEAAGQDVKAESVHTVEQELGDACGAIAFCTEMVKAASARPPQQPNGGKKP